MWQGDLGRVKSIWVHSGNGGELTLGVETLCRHVSPDGDAEKEAPVQAGRGINAPRFRTIPSLVN